MVGIACKGVVVDLPGAIVLTCGRVGVTEGEDDLVSRIRRLGLGERGFEDLRGGSVFAVEDEGVREAEMVFRALVERRRTPESADSTANGTRIGPSNSAGCGSSRLRMAYCHSPLRFCHFLRTTYNLLLNLRSFKAMLCKYHFADSFYNIVVVIY